ncbi:MAG TPA: hypothetical protein VM925_09860, partial [Labilithrix sp.]|nr:hypothetical protein [Labilithrix sp.]
MVPSPLRVACCVALLAIGCRDAGTKSRPGPIGRSWVTPPSDPADGGLVAQKLPRITYRGGRFLRNPKIVTVTFTKDDPSFVARLEHFGDAITRSSWWREVVDSYCTKPDDCIGEAGQARSVRLEDVLPSSVRDVDVDDVLVRAAEAGRFGPLDPETLLLVYLPGGVRLK